MSTPSIAIRALAASALLASLLRAESPPVKEPEAPAAAPESPVVEKTGDHQFKVGLVEFDSKTREVRFPAWVNMHQGMIEFPVVHENGRVHEAIFATKALPLHLETALRLLRYKPSKEVFPTYPGVDLNNPPPPEEWPKPVFPPAQPESHVQVFATWAGQAEPVDIRTMLYRSLDTEEKAEHEVRFDKLAPHWIFTGSTEKMGTQVESLGGAMVGIRTEPECSFNTVPDDAVHELEWFADPKRVPAPDTKVTIHIRPIATPAIEEKKP